MICFQCIILAGAVSAARQVNATSVLEFAPSDSVHWRYEDEGSVVLFVLRTGDPQSAASVDFATFDGGSAKSGEDYLATQGRLRFAPGETNKLIYVHSLNDGRKEDSEFFEVKLMNPSEGSQLGSRSVEKAFIIDNDNGVTFSQSAYSVDENAGSALITVSRGDDGPDRIVVNYTTSEGTATQGLITSSNLAP